MRHNHCDEGDAEGQVKLEKKHFECDIKGCSFKADSIKGLKEHKSSSHKKTKWYLNKHRFKCKWCDHTTVCQGGYSIDIFKLTL